MSNRKLILQVLIGALLSNNLGQSFDVQRDYGKVESWTLIAPRKSEELTAPLSEDNPSVPQDEDETTPQLKGDESYPDEYPPLTQPIPDYEDTPEIPQDYGLCPVVEDSQNTTTFYDLILIMTENEINFSDEASFTLRTEMHRYINAYGACACPSSRVYFDDVYRMESSPSPLTASYPGTSIMRSFLRRASRKLVSKGRNKMAAPGMYMPPPKVNLVKLISDSVNKRRRMMRLNIYDQYPQYQRHLQTNPSCEYVSTSFAERLNSTKEFNGKILNATVDENSMSSCATDENTCTRHISYGATCDKNHYDSTSLCQLSCCCNFPNSTSCQNILLSKKCEYNSFCDTGLPDGTYMPSVILKKSVYFPGVGELVKKDFI